MRVKIFLIIVLFISLSFSQSNFKGNIILKINGHSYTVPDVITEEMQKFWELHKDEIAAKAKGQKEGDKKVRKLTFADKISAVRFESTGNADQVRAQVFIENNDLDIRKNVLIDLGLFEIDSHIDFSGKCDMVFNLLLDIEYGDSLQVAATVLDADYKITNFKFDKSLWEHITSAGLSLSLYTIIETVYSQFGGDLDDEVGKRYVLLDLQHYDVSAFVGNSTELQTAIDDLKASIPFDLTIDYSGAGGPFYHINPYGQLIFDLKFLHGYTNDADQFNDYFDDIELDQIPNDQLDFAGFGYLHWGKLDNISKNNPTLRRMERFDILLDNMENMNFYQLRIEAVWNKIVPMLRNDSLHNDLDPNLDPDLIDSSDVTDYIARIDSIGGWDMMDSLVNEAESRMNRLIVAVGCGHQDRPPRVMDNGIEKIIAPGNIRGANPKNVGGTAYHFLGVDENIYLYWLVLYTRAVVRRYSDKVIYWQAENELNAARFTESFDNWWRKGDAWEDDALNGFQTDVAEYLYNAIHDEFDLWQSGQQCYVVQAFHIINAAKRLVEWRDYYDVVGLNFYPHLFHAYPVAGFMTGELVFSARRILKYLGATYGSSYEDKDIWITETGYPAKTDLSAPDDLAQNVKHFSQERQVEYIDQVMNSCAQYGAGAVQWYLMATAEDTSSDTDMEQINNWLGFFDENDVQKDGYLGIKQSFDNKINGAWISFTNKYQSDNLGGTFDIKKVASGISSGDSLRLSGTKTYNARTNRQYLFRIAGADTDTVVHHNWNIQNGDYKLNNDVNIASGDNANQEARFQYTYPVQFSVSINGSNDIDVVKKIKVRDPWRVNGFNNQPNEFNALSVTTDTSFYDVFLYHTPNQSPIWYSVEAPHVGGATTQDIYVFDHWSGSGVTITSPYSEETAVEFENTQGMQLTAHYAPVISQSGYTLVIPEDEVLEIPADADYSFASGFSIKCYGDFNVHGQPDKPVFFSGTGKDGNFDPTNQVPSDTLITIIGDSMDIYFNFLTIDSTQCAITFKGKDNELTMKHCTFKNMNVGLHIGAIENLSILIDSLSFSENDIGLRIGNEMVDVVQQSEVHVRHCLFEDNEYDFFFSPTNTISANSELELNFENCNFIMHGTSQGNGVFLQQVGSNPHGTIEVYLYNNIFYNTSCSLLGASYYYGSNNLSYPNSSSYLGSNVINSDPQFINYTDGNYHIRGTSPCVDAGLYLDTNDPDCTTPDIGLHYYPQLRDTITSDMVIEGECIIDADLTIPNSVSITFLPGTVVKLEDDATVKVYGKFMAEGTADSMITFTSVYTSPSSSQYWDRIRFYNAANDSNAFKYCQFKYAYTALWADHANLSVTYCDFDSLSGYGVSIRYAYAQIKNNDFSECKYGIHLYYCNDYSDSHIYDNTIKDGATSSSYGIYLYRSSPYLRDNEIDDCYYGLLCTSYSSPSLGWLGTPGDNYVHNTNYALYASYASDPTLGEDMCTTNGGHNDFVNNTYQIYAQRSCTILAENNWWGSASPDTVNEFYVATLSSYDITPWLPSDPLTKPSVIAGGHSEASAFDAAFKTASDSTLTEEEVMESFDPEWPIMRKLVFAKNLIQLDFPKNTAEICKDVLNNYPDSAQAYFALDLLWQSGRLYSTEFEDYKTALDSFSLKAEEAEIYEEAQLLSSGYNDAAGVSKGVANYQRFKTPAVATHELYNTFMFHLVEKEDYAAASAIVTIMENEFPEYALTKEARLLLDSMGDNKTMESEIIPDEFVLYHNYPNPFNPATTFKFALPVDSKVKLTIFNILGQKVRAFTQTDFSTGIHTLTWDGRNDSGVLLPSGMYIYRFEAEASGQDKLNYTKSGKMILIK